MILCCYFAERFLFSKLFIIMILRYYSEMETIRIYTMMSDRQTIFVSPLSLLTQSHDRLISIIIPTVALMAETVIPHYNPFIYSVSRDVYNQIRKMRRCF